MENMNVKQVVRGIIIAALGSVLVYAALAFFTDAPAMAAALRSFPLQVFALMLALSMVCFVVRGVRWGALMRVTGYPVSNKDALYLQLSGQTMSVTPGRVGEVLKPWLASNITDMPMTSGIALVFSERLADLIAVCFLSLGGLSTIGGNMWVLVAALSVIVAGTGVASSRWFHGRALAIIERQEWSRKHHASATAISATIQASLTWRTMLWSVGASVVAWGAEGVGFGLCLYALGFTKLTIRGSRLGLRHLDDRGRLHVPARGHRPDRGVHDRDSHRGGDGSVERVGGDADNPSCDPLVGRGRGLDRHRDEAVAVQASFFRAPGMSTGPSSHSRSGSDRGRWDGRILASTFPPSETRTRVPRARRDLLHSHCEGQ